MHSSAQRSSASCQPLVLADERTLTVEGYMPAQEDLCVASGGKMDCYRTTWIAVEGPHLRTVRTKFARNKTGIVGISISRRKDGRHELYVNLGKRHRRFCIETLGATEAWRRALQLRGHHELKVAQANAAILAARARHDRKGGGL